VVPQPLNPLPHILLVEDLANLRTPLRSLLELHGFCVAEASHGREALDHLQRSRPDAIVTDIDMPVMDGRALCRHLAADTRTRDLPVVLMSGYAWDFLDEARELFGPRCETLSKPFPIAHLVATLRRLLHNPP